MREIYRELLHRKKLVYQRLLYWAFTRNKPHKTRQAERLLSNLKEQEVILIKICNLLKDIEKLERKSKKWATKSVTRNKKPVELIEGGEVKKFDSILSASKHLKVSALTLSNDIKNSGKYGVRFTEK
jgi:hypothetical protein